MKRKNKKCSIKGCHHDTFSKGLCATHYARLRRTGTTDQRVVEQKECKVVGCKEPAICKGFCNAHYHKFKRGNLIEEVSDDSRTETRIQEAEEGKE